MSFDIIRYARIMDELILKLEQVPSETDPANGEALVEICSLLRIARIDIAIYPSPKHEQEDQGQCCTILELSEGDEENKLRMREITGNSNVGIYTFFPCKDDEPWTKDETDRIHVLEKMLFAFHGRRRVMRIAEDMMYKDPQLGIYNLNYFIKTLNRIVAQGYIGKYGACYFNLKRFSVINDQVGREAGTELMRRYIETIQSKLPGEEYVIRIGGDNFAALFLKEHVNDVTQCMCGVALNTDISGLGRVVVSSHSGFFMIPPDCPSASYIMDRIGAAKNVSKHIAKVPYVFFDEETQKRIEDAKRLESIFPSAIENEEFLVYYQPKVRLDNCTVYGAEALCRWKHKGEIIPPMNFIPILEQSHSVCLLDFYMLEHVCRDIRRWLDSGLPTVKISVNFSRVHLGDVDLSRHILEIIDCYRIPHHLIEIELTETTTDVDFRELKKVVTELNRQSVSTSVDDFGVGYSSLNLIRDLPWDVLKIDKSFLPDGTTDSPHEQKKRVVMKHLIAMAQSLGLECIVEGVETAEQTEILKENKCNLAQGYYFDKPLPVEIFEGRLSSLKDKISCK